MGVRVSRAELVRLRLAQHWARGGLLSQPGEPWRPACIALALVALAHDELELVDGAIAAELGAEEAQLANIFSQARGELEAARAAETAEVPNSSAWPTEALRVRARELLEHARQSAGALIAERARGNLHAPDGSAYVAEATRHDPRPS